jgi:hypothetical protein
MIEHRTHVMRFQNYLATILLLLGAAFTKRIAAHTPPEGYLLGWTTPDSLCRFSPEFQPVPGIYQPAENAIQLLRRYDKPLTILVFFGSWCSDSKREMPNFFAIFDLVHNQNYTVKLFGLDRSKKDAGGWAESFQISRVPTFIFLPGERDFSQNGLASNKLTTGEFGRIVETPTASIEQDWVNILKQDGEWSRQLEFERRILLLMSSIVLFVIH